MVIIMKYIFILFLTLNLFADHDHFIAKDLTHLNLSDSQYEKIKKELKAYQKSMKKFRHKRKESLIQKKRIFLKDNLDLEALRVLDLELAKEFSRIKLELLYKLHSTLDENQREKFLYYLKEWDED